MPTIEFIYDRDCPNVEAARAELSRALQAAGLEIPWGEWDRANEHAPDYVRTWGSPTILVNGKDIAGMPPGDASACRIYRNDKGNTRGIPDAQLILAALADAKTKTRGPMQVLAALPAVGGALLPKLTCAACWPAYTALLGALGVEFADYTPYLLPVTAVALAIALLGLGWRARSRRGFKPLMLGIAAGAVILVGKFAFDSDNVAYTGAAALIGATVWNLWPRRAACGACCSTASDNVRSNNF